MNLNKHLLDIFELEDEEADAMAQDIRNGIADELKPYLGEDYRMAEKTIRDGD